MPMMYSLSHQLEDPEVASPMITMRKRDGADDEKDEGNRDRLWARICICMHVS